MEESNEKAKNMEDVLLPGFRFHPTDEELVSFYLKRKVEHRPLSIKLITQLDIYKYDPWDLPKFAMTGEKEWYFYCPRDRKYKNSTRPNRVTGAGFWKATGTDRPIYSSEGNKCIGLRKSLVFYRGRAAKAIKTDWMMHEFRLPSSPSSHNLFDTPFSPNDSWAICRISKKTNTTALRTISHSFVSSTPQEAHTDKKPCKKPSNTAQVSSNKASDCTSSSTPFFDLDFTSSGSLGLCQDEQYLRSLLLSPQQTQAPHIPIFINNDNDMISSYLLHMSSSSSGSSLLGGYTNVDLACALLAQEQCPALVSLPQEYHETSFVENMMSNVKQDHNHALCHLSSTVVEDQRQEQKQNMLLETYYSSLSSINDDLPASFSIT